MEGVVADARHTIGDSDGGEFVATNESPLADVNHAVGDDKVCDFSIFID